MTSHPRRTGQRPAVGDVVIERDAALTNAFRVRVAPDNTAPLAITAQEVAVRLGRSVAENAGTDLWLCDDAHCRRLLSFRRGAA